MTIVRVLLSVIIPANNEAGYIENCLESLIGQYWPSSEIGREIIVAANGCTDNTVPLAHSYITKAARAGWDLVILDIADGSKINALNEADEISKGSIRAYIDADIVCDNDLIYSLVRVLDKHEPAYATGEMKIAPAKTWVSQNYAKIWEKLPFMTQGAQGAGLFAVNATGRARWGAFPAIISDDTFVRVLFKPEERYSVSAGFYWPLPEGWSNLVKVRRRQDAGMAEMHEKYPEIMANEAKCAPPTGRIGQLAIRYPISFLTYLAVKLAVRFGGSQSGWARGR